MSFLKKQVVALLLWSQKYTKADMLYIARGGFWIAFAQALNGLLSLILIVAFANLLPKETYGLYRYILSIAGILTIFTLTGMNSAVSRAVAKGEDGILKPAVHYQLKWNAMMAVACMIVGVYYYINDNTVFAFSFMTLAIFTPLTLAFNTYSAFLEGKKEFKRANILNIASTLTYTIGTLALLFITDNVVWLIGIYASATFIPAFVFYLYILRTFKPPTEPSAETMKFGRELTYLRMMDPIIGQIDKIILGHFWGPAHLATYTLALAIPNRITLFIKSWVTVGFPKFSTKTATEINSVFKKRVFQGLLLGSLIAFLYACAVPVLFTYVLPQYLDSIFYAQLLGIGIIFALPNRYMTLLFTSQGESKRLFTRTFVMSITNITLCVILGIQGGILGLVIAHILFHMYGFCLNIYMWRQLIKKSA